MAPTQQDSIPYLEIIMHKGFVFRKAECIKPLCVVEKRCVGGPFACRVVLASPNHNETFVRHLESGALQKAIKLFLGEARTTRQLWGVGAPHSLRRRL